MEMKKNAVFAILLAGVFSAGESRADVYDAARNQLTIPNVDVGATTYTNVVVTVGTVLSVGGSKPVGTSGSSSVPILGLVGSYQGTSPGGAFGTDSTTLTISIAGNVLTIVQSEFFAGTTRYTANIGADGSSIFNGTYQTSNFASGTWSLNQISSGFGDAPNDLFFSATLTDTSGTTASQRFVGWK